MSGSHPYVGKNTAKDISIGFYGVLERKKFADDI